MNAIPSLRVAAQQNASMLSTRQMAPATRKPRLPRGHFGQPRTGRPATTAAMPIAPVVAANSSSGSNIEVRPDWHHYECIGARFRWCVGEELNLHVLADTSS